jgi:hypothetical protein
LSQSQAGKPRISYHDSFHQGSRTSFLELIAKVPAVALVALADWGFGIDRLDWQLWVKLRLNLIEYDAHDAD